MDTRRQKPRKKKKKKKEGSIFLRSPYFCWFTKKKLEAVGLLMKIAHPNVQCWRTRCYSRMNFCIWSLGTWKYILGMRSPSHALSFTCLHSYILISLHIIRFGYFYVSGLRSFQISPCISHKKRNVSVILSESWSFFPSFTVIFYIIVLLEFNLFLYFLITIIVQKEELFFMIVRIIKDKSQSKIVKSGSLLKNLGFH